MTSGRFCGKLSKQTRKEGEAHVKEGTPRHRASPGIPLLEELLLLFGGVHQEDVEHVPHDLAADKMAVILDPADEAMPYGDYLASYIGRWVHEEDRERVAGELSPENVRRKLSGDLTFYINYRVVERGVVEYLQIRFVNVGRKDRASQVVLGCRRMDEELRREMEQKQTLEEALYNANSSIMAKNTFLSNMSHDMRTPLNAIFGFTALARHHLDSPEAIAGYLDRIESSSRQLLDMIDKVLKLSWIDSNEAPPGLWRWPAPGPRRGRR